MKKYLLLFFFPYLLIAGTSTVIDAPELLTEMQTLAHQGPLRKTSEGFVYVKVSNEYILKALELLKEDQLEAPAYFGQGMVGAHITVIEKDEAKGKRLQLPPMGTIIPFEIVNLSSIDMTNEYGAKRLYILTVNAPELEQIRIKNGLPSKVHGHEFHITVAVQLLSKN